MSSHDLKVQQAYLAMDRRDEPGMLQEATEVFEQCLPDSEALAHCYALAGRWDEALRIYERQAFFGRYGPGDPSLEGFDQNAFLMAHSSLVEVEQIDAAALLQEAIEVCRRHFGDSAIDVQIDRQDGLPLICGCRANLRRVMLIVLENAFEAILDRPIGADRSWYDPWADIQTRIKPIIQLDLSQDAQRNGVLLTCRDHGIGLPRPWRTIPEETAHWVERRKHLFAGDVGRTRQFLRGSLPMNEAELEVWLFKPGWTSKGKGFQRPRGFLQNGPGMGLYMARQILHKHVGSISVARAQDAGALVQVRLSCNRRVP